MARKTVGKTARKTTRKPKEIEIIEDDGPVEISLVGVEGDESDEPGPVAIIEDDEEDMDDDGDEGEWHDDDDDDDDSDWDDDDEDEEVEPEDDDEDYEDDDDDDETCEATTPQKGGAGLVSASNEPPSEHELLQKISAAETDAAFAESRVNSAKSELKSCKEEYNTAVIKLRKLCAALTNDQNRPLFKQPQPKPEQQPPVVDSGTVEPAANPIDQPAAADDSWRHVPLVDIGLDNIKGLGKGKIETLVQACPNLGAFEDLRAGEGLTSLKGIGPTLASELENAVLDWLSKNRDQAVLAEARDMAPITEAEEQEAVAESKELENL